MRSGAKWLFVHLRNIILLALILSVLARDLLVCVSFVILLFLVWRLR